MHRLLILILLVEHAPINSPSYGAGTHYLLHRQNPSQHEGIQRSEEGTVCGVWCRHSRRSLDTRRHVTHLVLDLKCRDRPSQARPAVSPVAHADSVGCGCIEQRQTLRFRRGEIRSPQSTVDTCIACTSEPDLARRVPSSCGTRKLARSCWS